MRRSRLAVGNVVGSNIFNVLFTLGASALIAPLVVARQLVQQEVSIIIGTSLLLGALCPDGRVSNYLATKQGVVDSECTGAFFEVGGDVGRSIFSWLA